MVHRLGVHRVRIRSQVDRHTRWRVIKAGSRQQVSKSRRLMRVMSFNRCTIPVNLTSSAAKKKSAPNAPVGTVPGQQPIYGTLPHSVGRYQQSYDLSDIYNNSNNTSTLPHPPRNSMTQNNTNNNSASAVQPQQHFDNKVYERFEPYMMQANKASHKRSPSSDSITRSINLGEFKLSCSYPIEF